MPPYLGVPASKGEISSFYKKMKFFTNLLAYSVYNFFLLWNKCLIYIFIEQSVKKIDRSLQNSFY